MTTPDPEPTPPPDPANVGSPPGHATTGQVPVAASDGEPGDGGSGAGSRRRYRQWTVRTRVVASMLGLSLLGMAVAGASTFAVQLGLMDSAATAALQQEVEEFRALASEGVDPETGQPFTSVDQLLRIALQRNVPEDHETYLTVVDGAPLEYDGGARPIELEKEPEVLDAIARALPGGSAVLEDVDTSVGPARLAMVPVGIEGSDSTGMYVMAFHLGGQRDEMIGLMRTYVLVSLAALAVVGIVGWVVAGRLLRPLRLLRDTTQRISETDLTERIPVRGADDITDLTRTYNAMLDRLQHAFDTERRLLDDAGHELRTPVTILRGHLELLDPRDPTEVADTRALLLDETDRMSRLVEDLILLAKARRPDFVRLAPLDLAPFTDDVAETARGLGDRRWSVDGLADVVVDADAQRLRQAVLQLADNAVKYSEPGSAVRIGSAVDGDHVRVWVADEGAGIHTADQERIFERFGRAETGRGVEGSGLGLSIVDAIARAHDGRVEVRSRLGHGSVFTLVLPLPGGDPDSTDPDGTVPDDTVPDDTVRDGDPDGRDDTAPDAGPPAPRAGTHPAPTRRTP